MKDINLSNKTPVAFTPQEVITIFRDQLQTPLRVVYIEGIYIQNTKSENYGGYFYDILKGQNDTFEMTIIVPLSIRDKLKNGTLVQFAGTVSKEVRSRCIIELQFRVTRYEILDEDVISDQQKELIMLQAKKAAKGYKNVDMVLESLLFKGIRPQVCLLFAANSLTSADFQAGVEAASSHIDFFHEQVTFTQIDNFIRKLIELDRKKYDVLAIVRGGGSGIKETFDNPELAKMLISIVTPIISGVGHPEERPFIAKIADKDLKTPSLLGTYFKDIVNAVTAQREKSKAVLIDQVKKQYIERINSAEKQNKELQDKIIVLNKNAEEIQKLYKEQNSLTNKQNEDTNKRLKAYEDQFKTLSENISKMQQTNKLLQESLSKLTVQNSESAKHLLEAKSRAAQLEEQLRQSKKGCMPGCMSVIIVFIVFAISVCLYSCSC